MASALRVAIGRLDRADRFMHEREDMMAPDLLRKLLRACVDDWRTLRHESKLVDESRAGALTELASARERFVVDLERLAKREQPRGGSWRELSREAERKLWVTAAGRNNGDAIRSCRHSLARTEALYDEALGSAWPDEVQRVLTEQRRCLLEDADSLGRLQF